MLVRGSVVSEYQTTKEMIAYSYPRTVDGLKSEPYGENGFGGFPVSREPHTSGDLVSLSWLQKGNILQITPLDSEEDVTREGRLSTAPSLKEETLTSGYTVCPSHITVASNGSTLPTRLSLSSTTSQVLSSSYVGSSAFSNPYSQGLGKPCYSYTHLIFMAIESTPQKCMTVNQIYNWCEANFPFYKHAGAGWKNSLRHNLSINKSFKRLPRDGRGPGRGAYWAVEPRERQNLLGAVKRNPWSVNFNRERSVIRQLPCNAITDSTSVIGNGPFNRSEGASQLPGFNLSQSASEAVLRSSGIGMCNLMLPSNRSSTSSFALVDTTTGAKTNPDILNNTSTHDRSRGILQTSDASPNPISVANIDGTCFTSPSPRSNTLVMEQPKEVAEPSWSTEEEEKYQSMLRLLLESTGDVVTSKPPSACSKSGPSNTIMYSPLIPPKDGNRYGGPNPVKKESTKQRRKSCLYPTNEGMCNDCKENKAPTCRSCQLRMLQAQGVSTSRSTLGLLSKLKLLHCGLTDGALEELIDILDSDQEQGPAGGPAVCRTAVKTEEATSACSGKQSPANGDNSESGEVFITPAPHLDHEYAHCQKQLRRPEDLRVVELYNSRYRKNRLQFLRNLAENRLSHSNSRASMRNFPPSHSMHNAFGIDGEELDSENSVSMLEDTPQCSSDYDSDITSEMAVTYKNGTLDYTRLRCERLRTQALRDADTIEDYDSLTIARPVRRKRGRPVFKGKSSGRNSGRSIRRSSRAVRAPKRPHDDDLGDAEDYDSSTDLPSPRLCVDEGDYERVTSNPRSYDCRMHPFGKPYRRRSRLVPRLIPSSFSSSTFREANTCETKTFVDSQIHTEKRRFGRWPGPASPSTAGDSTDEFTAIDSDGEFVNHADQPLQHKVRRLSKQSAGSIESRNNLYFSRRQPGRPPSTVTHEASKLKIRRKEASQAFSLGSASSSYRQRHEVATGIEEGPEVGGKDSPVETPKNVICMSADHESVDEEGSDKSSIGALTSCSQEQTTVEAAQILLGIGKIQDLHRKMDHSDAECRTRKFPLSPTPPGVAFN